MERQKFEDSWKDAFKDAEARPSENLWTSIELDLEKADGQALKRRVLMFKLMAAASVVFAMCFGALFVYQQANTDDPDLLAVGSRGAEYVEMNKPNEKSSELPESERSSLSGSGLPSAAQVSEQKKSVRTVAPVGSITISATTQQSLRGEGSESGNQMVGSDEGGYSIASSGNEVADNVLLKLNNLPPIVPHRKIGLPVKEPDPVELMLARLAQEELKYREDEQKDKKKENKDEQLWTSVGFAAGSFNTVTSGTQQFASLQLADFSSSVVVSNNAASDQSKASGVSYSAGINLGTKVASRWVLQGGVNYLVQSSSYTTNAVISSNQTFKAASITELTSRNNSSATIVNTAPYGVDNSLQYISVPMQAGYLLVNRNFGLQVNAGVATDMFLQNTVTPHADGLEKTTQGSGEDSPYRAVNFSGLVGTEISYRLGQHFRLSVNPGLRYPFSSIYKSELGVDAMPFTFDVGLRFRYIFR